MPTRPATDLRGERFHFPRCGVHPFPPLGLKTPHRQWELREVPASICIFNMRSAVVVDSLVMVSAENAAHIAGLVFRWWQKHFFFYKYEASNLFIYRIALVDLSIRHPTQVIKEAFSSHFMNSCSTHSFRHTAVFTTPNINRDTPY